MLTKVSIFTYIICHILQPLIITEYDKQHVPQTMI